MNGRQIKILPLCSIKILIKSLLLLTVLLLPVQLRAQQPVQEESVAIVPFWGSNDTIIEEFGEELTTAVDDTPEYSSAPVDMVNLPPDVPEGGFPPYICPSPSLTKESPYAITGEVSEDPDDGRWHLRMYLWQMSDNRLIYSDELAVYTREECASSMPGMLSWMFSWLAEDGSDNPETVLIDQSKILYFTDTEPVKWLYFGLRAGGSVRIYSGAPGGFLPNGGTEMVSYKNVQVAAHAYAQLISFLGIQIEGNYTYVIGDNSLESMSMTFPFMLRASYRWGTMTAALFGGGYYSLPIGEQPFTLDGPPLGYTAGLMFGNKIGPGYVYLDIRWASDVADSVNVTNNDYYYHKNSISVSAGYEIGVFKK